MKFQVIICSVSRPAVLHATVVDILRQMAQPERVVLCVSDEGDYDEATLALDARIRLLIAPERGLTSQRNYAFQASRSNAPEVTAFLDDDVALDPHYFATMLTFFAVDEMLIGASAVGLLGGRTIQRDQARAALSQFRQREAQPRIRYTGKHWVCHGCNMLFRSTLFDIIAFDEALPLYSYAEDYDFSIRAARYGRIGRISGVGFVHLAHSEGRVSEKRRGYSMVANNLYFLKKGVRHRGRALSWIRFWAIIVLKETLQTAWRAASPKERDTADPLGHLKGRAMAIIDIMRGRSSPSEILNPKRFNS